MRTKSGLTIHTTQRLELHLRHTFYLSIRTYSALEASCIIALYKCTITVDCSVSYGSFFSVFLSCLVVFCLLVFGCQYQCNRLSANTRHQNDLLCVEWAVKPYTLTHSLHKIWALRFPVHHTLCMLLHYFRKWKVQICQKSGRKCKQKCHVCQFLGTYPIF